jgi:hypothetical protein
MQIERTIKNNNEKDGTGKINSKSAKEKIKKNDEDSK